MSKKILVVDDSPFVIDTIEMILAAEGHILVTAKSGAEALDKLTPDFDLVITDLMMPGMDGFELIKAIKQRQPNLPIIVLTAGSTTASIRHTEAGGSSPDLSAAKAVLEKPIEMDALIEAINLG